MSRPKVEQINFQEFKRAVERAIVNGTRILPREKDRWVKYVATHQVRETNFQAYARAMFEYLEPLILDEPAPWGGYYMWSVDYEVVLRWNPPTPDP